MSHIEIEKISEREIVQKDKFGNPIKIPGQHDSTGQNKLLKKNAIEIVSEVIKIENIKSCRPWRKASTPEWKAIEGEVTVLYMEGEDRKDSLGENIHCTILINESYDSFSSRIGASRVKKYEHQNGGTEVQNHNPATV